MSCGVVVVATVMWLLFERSGLPFLTICSDVLLILVVLLFIRANFAAMRNRSAFPKPCFYLLIFNSCGGILLHVKEYHMVSLQRVRRSA